MNRTKLLFRQQVVGFFHDAAWLDADRAGAWCRVLAIATAVFLGAFIITSRGGVDVFGKPLAPDFVSFWTASRFALSGNPASVYQPLLHQQAEFDLFPTAQPRYAAFFYPPTFLLLCLPLALLPYLTALATWLIAGLSLLYACVRRVVPQRWAILPFLAFPGVLANVGHGQNGFATAACFGGYMVWAERRPYLAGACLGLLVIKPHLLLAAPFALLAARRWRVIAGAVTSGLCAIALSWLVLGSAAWRGFIAISPLARATLEQGLVEPWKMQSVFAATRLLHGGVALGYGLQAVCAAFVCFYLARWSARRPGGMAEGGLLIVATMLCTPFLLDYDYVCLVLPIAWVVSEALASDWLGWEKSVLLIAYALPMLARPLGMVLHLPIGPAAVSALFVVIGRRAMRQEGIRQARRNPFGLSESSVA